VDIGFPTYSKYKYFSIKPDVIESSDNTELPVSNLIHGVEV
jgi:hypothetical protein